VTRGQVRRRLVVAWWQLLGLALAPLLVVCVFFDLEEPLIPMLAMPMFLAGIGSMFLSLKPFGVYKRALIATGAALNTPEELAAWQKLAAVRRIALLYAGLPAWIAAFAAFIGLEAIPVWLLALSSVVLFYLYRIPRQLG
jgi:hypothetical protein